MEGCREHFEQTGGQSETPNKQETNVSQCKKFFQKKLFQNLNFAQSF